MFTIQCFSLYLLYVILHIIFYSLCCKMLLSILTYEKKLIVFLNYAFNTFSFYKQYQHSYLHIYFLNWRWNIIQLLMIFNARKFFLCLQFIKYESAKSVLFSKDVVNYFSLINKSFRHYVIDYLYIISYFILFSIDWFYTFLLVCPLFFCVFNFLYMISEKL